MTSVIEDVIVELGLFNNEEGYLLPDTSLPSPTILGRLILALHFIGVIEGRAPTTLSLQ